jgi:hypothetical protein
LRDSFSQVPVGRGDDPHVGVRGRAVRADRLDFSRFEEAEEERLHPEAHLADLVEEERAPVGELELARLVAIRAGEASFDVSEQLRLEERFGQPGAVHGHEWPVVAGGVHVDRPGDQILADAAFTRDEDLGLPERRAARHGQHFEHGGAGGNDVGLPAGHLLLAAFGMIPFRHVRHDSAPCAARGLCRSLF